MKNVSNIESFVIKFMDFELVRFGVNQWSLKDPVGINCTSVWWYAEDAEKGEWLFTLCKEERKIMGYEEAVRLAADYIGFLDKCEWF